MKSENNRKIFEIAVTMVLIFWCVLLLAEKINLSTTDIGRHIKNGEIILNAPWPEKLAVLNTNFYSYTENNFAFINHHWLSGITFYLVYILWGFSGLSIFYIFLCTFAFYLLFRIAKNEIGIEVAAILSVLALPIITQRTEIRPEAVTYFLMAIFFYILWHWQRGNGYDKKIFILPVLMFLWVNLHLGFVFGFLLIGSFWIEELLECIKSKDNRKVIQLSIVLFLSIIAGLINPFFTKGLLYPLKIFKNYGYLVLENQSIPFLQNLDLGAGLHFGLIKLLYAAALLSFIFIFFKKKTIIKFPIHYFLIFAAVFWLSFSALRNFPFFALLFLPIVAHNIKFIFSQDKISYQNNLITASIIILVLFSLSSWKTVENKGATFGIALSPGVNAAADFFKRENLTGPIFNNYDIGGYLILHFFPKEKVFVDNRPEAYSEDFFKKIYIPAQENREDWRKLDAEHNFNTIFFYYRDHTPWAQKFLIEKINDSDWAPIFADAYNIIFLKRNLQNLELIKKYEIPRRNFVASK